MKHLSIELLERYALRELSSREQQQVETHLTGCPECLDRLQGEIGWLEKAGALRLCVAKTASTNRIRRMPQVV
jgi:anti-sigma factor RsiW